MAQEFATRHDWQHTRGLAMARAGIALGAVALLAAACGSAAGSGSNTTTSSGSGSGSGGYTPPGASSGGSGQAALEVATVTQVGKVLVDSSGKVVYAFSKDKHGMPTCDSGPCALAWPPVYVTGTPTAGAGVKASMLGTVRTSGGKLQLTYNHWPLYTYSGDLAPKQANGQGIVSFGGKWAAVTSAGAVVTLTGSGGSSGGGSSWG